MSQNTAVPLPEGTILTGRYVLGSPRTVTDAGTTYDAFDQKLRMPCEVFEFLPMDCSVRKSDGSIVPKEDIDPTIFTNKCQALRNGALQRFQDASSSIYDVIAVNGSVYLVQTTTKNNVSPANPELSANGMQDTAITIDIGGIFAAKNTLQESTEVSKDPTVVFPHEILQETPPIASKEKKEEQVPKAVPHPPSHALPKKHLSHVLPEEETLEEEDDIAENKTLSIKLLAILLVGIVVLLVLGVIIFVSVLQQITGNVNDISLIGVPVTEVSEAGNVEYLIVGSGSNSQYAPGTIIAEEQKGDVFHVFVNGVIPSYTLPDFIGMTYTSAQALLNRTQYNNIVGTVNANLVVEEVVDNTYVNGAVISQSPEAGNSITAGTAVTLQIAVNSEQKNPGNTITMPELCGEKYQPKLMGHPLLIRDKIYSKDTPAGIILYQYPSAGTKWQEDGVCYVVISAGPEQTSVPDLLYKTPEQAMEMLSAKGLSVVTEYCYAANIQEGLVVSQSLPGGTKTAFGETVTLTISGEGKGYTGPRIQTTTDAASLQIGDICTMELGTEYSPSYHSTNPEVVTIDNIGIITAHAPGSATITASIDGTAIAMTILVDYPEEKIESGVAPINKDFFLSNLTGSHDKTVWQWDILQGYGTVSDNGVFHTDTVGTVVLGGTNGNKSLLTVLTVENTDHVSVSKVDLKDADTAKTLLQSKGLSCVIQKEYSEKYSDGSVIRIQYSGYSDDKEYHFINGSTVVLIVSSSEPAVSSIAIKEKPTKLTYTAGETLDTTGMVITVTYENGTEKDITSGFTTSYDFSTNGRKTVAVSYGERKASFHVEVTSQTPEKLTIISKPKKTTYDLGKQLDTTGLEIQITYVDGSTKNFTSGFTVSYNFGEVGTRTVTVTMNNLSATFEVTVKEPEVDSLEIITFPSKLTCFQGDTPDTTDMKLRVHYVDGTSSVIKTGWTVSANTNMVGECSVTIIYGEKTVTYMVIVNGIDVHSVDVQKAPKKTEYMTEEKIDLTGLELTVTMNNGKTQTVSYPDDSITCSYDFSAAGEKWITVTYRGAECKFRVTVNKAALIKLTVDTLPKKLVYLSDEKLDTTGLILLAEYANGTSKKITDGYTCSYDFSEIGEVKISVLYEDMETGFFVRVAKDALLYTDPASLQLTIGESQTIRIYSQLADSPLTYSVSDTSVISVEPLGDLLVVKALEAGSSVIQLQIGTVTVECPVTVTVDTGNASYSAKLLISNQSTEYFMQTLVLTGSPTEDITVPFSAMVSFDASKIVLGDYGTMDSAVTLQYDGNSSVILSGSVKIPKGQSLSVAYFFFVGSEPSSCTLNITK